MTTPEDIPVWSSLGGSLVTSNVDDYVFIKVPSTGLYSIGDTMPKGWELIAVNYMARTDDITKGDDLNNYIDDKGGDFWFNDPHFSEVAEMDMAEEWERHDQLVAKTGTDDDANQAFYEEIEMTPLRHHRKNR